MTTAIRESMDKVLPKPMSSARIPPFTFSGLRIRVRVRSSQQTRERERERKVSKAEKRKSELVTYLLRLERVAESVVVNKLDLPNRKKKEKKKKEREKSAIVAKSEGM